MADWSETTWGDLATLEYGRALRGYEDQTGSYRVYGTNGPIGWHNDCLYEGPSVIVGRKGAYRGIHYAPDPFFVIDTAFFLKPKVPLDVRWAYYELLTHDINSMDSGSAIPSTSREAFYRLPVKVPLVAEQRAIASTLGALDDKIKLNRRMNETLEAMARAIFKDWFVDFGPTRAKMEGREPYLAPEIWSLFPDRLDTDGKPEGWNTWDLQEIAEQHKATVSPSKEPDQLFEHYSLPAYDAGQTPSKDLGESIKSNKARIPNGAILLSKLNPEISRVWVPDEGKGIPQVCSTEFVVFTPKPPAGRNLLYCLFSGQSFKQTMMGMVTGTSKSHQRVQAKSLLTEEVLYGAPEIFEAFENAVSAMLKRILANRAESRTLAQTRDLLLPKLMSGAIQVESARGDTELVK